ncbi:nucleoside phosphatase family-domain-containing protein [Multifurca ochricompacta]|uniref:guanosine-diphosphatase n=1 Tax=Multifurca ochricompacta TaxID=376703 RepID=A0AAD4M8B5_9AGAM|nr:nucleoside phosphatase family-domain-containing protein [Multifurca ochricompacta]
MISPRSGNYERLEGGLGPSRLGVRNIAWRKIFLCLIIIVGLVWLLKPPEQRVWSGIKVPAWQGHSDVDMEHDHSPPSSPMVEPHKLELDEPLPTSTPTYPSHPRPSSYESDPDPSKTVFCSTPRNPSSSLVQYALMIDAGSTGSRIHIYKFNNCGSSPVYEYEKFVQKNPGLSAYAGRPGDAAQSLDSLLDTAVRTVPEALHHCTPVAVKATAGLRLLGAPQAAEILDAVRERLSTMYPFPLVPEDPVAIMDGRDEGVYAWVTANYLMDTIRADSLKTAVPYAVLDLGGASTQIVFEPVFDSAKSDAALREGEHKYELKFGGKEHVLYQHSYLGYGLMRARKGVHRLVNFMASTRTTAVGAEIGNPCLARETRRVVEVEVAGSPATTQNVTMVGGDIGSFEACNRIMQLVMAKDAICEVKPCSFDGVYQPSLLDTFPNGKILLLSYFYDRINPLLPPSTSRPLTIASIADLATDVCLGQPSWEKRWGDNKQAMEELLDRPEYCLDLTFMHALLRLGYEFDDGRTIEIGKRIDGTELGWALGAAIAMVGGVELTCKA